MVPKYFLPVFSLSFHPLTAVLKAFPGPSSQHFEFFWRCNPGVLEGGAKGACPAGTWGGPGTHPPLREIPQQHTQPNPRVPCVKTLIHRQCFFTLLKIYLLTFRERQKKGGKKRERHWFALPLINPLTGCLLHVPWPEDEPASIAHRDDVPKTATRRGPFIHF